MPKSGRRVRRRPANALRRRPRRNGGSRPTGQELQRRAREPQGLLERILEIPRLAHVVPRLQPEVLHRVIQTCGLEDCAELVALATPDQLLRVFDLDLWHGGRPGLDEELDADRFGVWLEVLMESGAAAAAQTVARMDVDLVIAALAQHVLVFDGASVSRFTTLEGEEMPARRHSGDGIGCEVGSYLIEPRRAGPWDAIVALLLCLDTDHHHYFDRLMRGCRSLSSSGFELDGLDDLLSDREQDLFDLACDRERRREKQGYVAPAQARAFLQMARQFQVGEAALPPNPIAGAYFRALEWEAPVTTKESQPAPFAALAEPQRPRRTQSLQSTNTVPQRVVSKSSPNERDPANSAVSPVSAVSQTPRRDHDPPDNSDAIAAVVDLLVEAGVLPRPPRALLEDPGGAARLAFIRAQMQFLADSNHAAHSQRTEELAFLANTIMAGCSIQSRAFTVREASDAAAAICNLGLENWPSKLAENFLAGHDLIGVFQAGWTVLHRGVCMYAAESLIDVLSELRCGDREIQAALDALRIELARQCRDGTPWRAREALDVIMPLDMPAWATLVGLLDECPVIHAGMDASRGARPRTISATDFELISENSQIASVHRFFQALLETLQSA
jgi:hypothetical protein